MVSATHMESSTSQESRVQRAGVVCLVSGLLGAASAVFLAAVPPQVDDGVYSYPLAETPFVAIQVFFMLQHLGLVAGLVALSWAGAVNGSRLGRLGVAGAVAGMVLLALVELLAVPAADAAYPSATTDRLDALYGISTNLIGVSMVLAGIAVVRVGRWTGWRAALVLVTGVYVFVPLTPAIFGPFVLARLAIGGWMLLFAAVGWVLMQPTHEQDRARP